MLTILQEFNETSRWNAGVKKRIRKAIFCIKRDRIKYPLKSISGKSMAKKGRSIYGPAWYNSIKYRLIEQMYYQSAA